MAVTVDNVYYSYRSANDVLNGITFEIPEGNM